MKNLAEPERSAPVRHQQRPPEPHDFAVRNFLNQTHRPILRLPIGVLAKALKRASSTRLCSPRENHPATIARVRCCRIASCLNVRDENRRLSWGAGQCDQQRRFGGCFHRAWQVAPSPKDAGTQRPGLRAPSTRRATPLLPAEPWRSNVKARNDSRSGKLCSH